MKKRVLSALLLIAMLMTMLPTCAFAEEAQAEEVPEVSEESATEGDEAPGIADDAAEDGWVIDGDKTYYYQNGTMVTDQVLCILDHWYYFMPSGEMAKNYLVQRPARWPDDERDIFYATATGELAADFWYTDDEGNRYYFGSNRYAVNGAVTIDGKKYGFQDYILAINSVIQVEDYPIWAEGGYFYYYCTTATGELALNCWYTADNGEKYYFGSDGQAVEGIQSIDGDYYYFEYNGHQSAPVMATGGLTPIRVNDYSGCFRYDNCCYAFSDGKLAVNYWYTDENGDRYYFGSNAKAVEGIQTIDNDKYYFVYKDSASAPTMASDILTQAYVDDWGYPCGPYLYFTSEGYAAKSAWYTTDNGEKMYFGSDAYSVEGLQTIDGKGYYFNDSYIMQTGWIQSGSNYYYFSSSGAMCTNAWIKSGKYWYYLEANGVMARGWYKVNNTWYFFASSGAMKTGWLKSGGKWYYLQSSGAMVKGWQKIGRIYYYFNSDGSMKTGWLKSGKAWYYLKSNGAMSTGWLKIGTTYYYFSSSGAMYANKWVSSGGKWYYLKSSGAMAQSETLYISGKYYRFDANGAMR